MNKFNWQLSQWPEFEYDLCSIQDEIYQYGKMAGMANGAVSQLSQELQYEAYVDLMVSEAINTSEIEGEHLNRKDVRSSIRNYLGLNSSPERVGDVKAEGIAALMVSVRNNYQTLLTKERLFEWHTLLLHSNEDLLGRRYDIGQWRTDDMDIVSGPVGYEKTHYVAPPPEVVPVEMTRFIEWFNNTHPMHSDDKIPGPIRAAIAHIWFESIHPFSDGNGRIGRALSEVILAQDMHHPVLLSLSTEIEKNRKHYYEELSFASKTLNITQWIIWFVNTINKAQSHSKEMINHILRKSKFWDIHQKTLLNKRQKKVISKMFEAGPAGFQGGISAKKYTSMTKCSKATATRDLTELRKKSILIETGTGRGTKYDLNI